LQGGSLPDTARYITTQQHVSIRQHPSAIALTSAFVEGKLPLPRGSLADTAVLRKTRKSMSGFFVPLT
jgi:hypothetical protein